MGIASDLRQSVLLAAMQGKLTTQKAEDGDAKDLLLSICEEKEKLVKEKKGKKGHSVAPMPARAGVGALLCSHPGVWPAAAPVPARQTILKSPVRPAFCAWTGCRLLPS